MDRSFEKQEGCLLCGTNTAGQKIEGCASHHNGEVCRIRTGSPPLLNHFYAVKIAILAQADLIAAIKYINDRNFISKKSYVIITAKLEKDFDEFFLPMEGA